jgi:hypothetical protein
MAPDDIALGRALTEYGFDSIRAISLKYTVEMRVAHPVPLEWLIGNACINSIVDRLDDFNRNRQNQAVVEIQRGFQVNSQLLSDFLSGELDLEHETDANLDDLLTQMTADEEMAHVH